MKIFVMDKYAIFTFVLILALAAIALPLSVTSVLEVATEVKVLPVYCVERADNAVALTFNCAWDESDIDSVLETLQKHNAKCTFFLVGTWAQKYPDAVKKIQGAGHEIGSHSYNHTLYTMLSAAEIKDDIKKCDEIIESITQTPVTLLRVPSGDYNNTAVSCVRECAKECIQWDVDSLDWKGLDQEQMLKRIMGKVKSGSIILMHTGAKNTAASLDAILSKLEEKGFHFSIVGDMLHKGSTRIDHSGMQMK